MISPSSSKWLMWFGICFYYVFGMWGAGIRLRIFLLNNGTLALADYKLYHPPACYTYSLSSIYNRLLSYLSWSYIINYNSLPLHMVFSRTVLSAPYFHSDRVFKQKQNLWTIGSWSDYVSQLHWCMRTHALFGSRAAPVALAIPLLPIICLSYLLYLAASIGCSNSQQNS